MNGKLPAVLFCSLILLEPALPQAIPEKLRMAVQKLEADPQMRHGILSLHVADAATGAVVFDRNGQTGLAPASCQKLFTSVAAFEMLGPGYRYATLLGYDGSIVNGTLEGDL